jgi:hypothetical protein
MLFLVADYLAGVTIGTMTAIAVRETRPQSRHRRNLAKSRIRIRREEICVSTMSNMIVNREDC